MTQSAIPGFVKASADVNWKPGLTRSCDWCEVEALIWPIKVNGTRYLVCDGCGRGFHRGEMPDEIREAMNG